MTKYKKNPNAKSNIAEDNRFELELEKLEQDSQKMLDDKIIAVGSGLLGLSFGFVNSIKSIIQTHLISQILFIFVIISLSITITYSVFSHFYSAYIFRAANEKFHYNLNSKFDINNAAKRIKQLNFIQTFGFIITIISMVIFLIFISSNTTIWMVKSTMFSLFCFLIIVMYHCFKKLELNEYITFLINLMIFLFFILGAWSIWQTKANNKIIQILLS